MTHKPLMSLNVPQLKVLLEDIAALKLFKY